MGAVEFVLTNPPGHKGRGSGGSKMAGNGKHITRYVGQAAARGGRKFMGLSVPVFEQGAATAAGVFGANVISAKVAQVAGVKFLSTWYGKVIVKIASAVLMKMLVGKVQPRWGNAVLGGGLASAALTLAKQFLPANSTALQGLAGDVAETFSAGFAGYGGDGDLGDLQQAVNAIEANLAGADWSGDPDAAMGMYGLAGRG